MAIWKRLSHLDDDILLFLKVILAFNLGLEFGVMVVLDPFCVPYQLMKRRTD